MFQRIHKARLRQTKARDTQPTLKQCALGPNKVRRSLKHVGIGLFLETPLTRKRFRLDSCTLVFPVSAFVCTSAHVYKGPEGTLWMHPLLHFTNFNAWRCIHLHFSKIMLAHSKYARSSFMLVPVQVDWPNRYREPCSRILSDDTCTPTTTGEQRI